ncbi:MAG TPA: ABC transporter permease [Thermoleophilaceae bacterium]|jgi:ABC-2 type transport system permease protein
MRHAAALASAAGAICKRDLLIFASYRTRFFTTFFTTAVSVTLFYYVSRLVSSPRFGSADDYYAFVVVGIVIFTVLTSTLITPVATLRAELQAGTFERMVLSPFGPVRSIASLLLFPLLLAFAMALLTLAYAGLVFSLNVRWSTAVLALPVGLLGAVAFAPFGLLLTAAVVLFKGTNAGATFVMTGVTLLAGVYFPVALLPDWIEWASDVQPFTPAVDLLRNVLVGTPLAEPAGAAVAKLVGFTVVLLPLSILTLRGALARSRRKGTIIEY